MPMSPSPSQRACTAFTLVELLAVIAIVGTLAALLLPAVQATREQARRMQCCNHLKQVGLALHNYESARRTWPAHSSEPAKGKGFAARRGSWFTSVLPYFEEDGLFNSFDPTKHWHDTVNEKAVMTPVPALRCPSAPDRDGFEWTVLVDYANETATTATTSARAFYPGGLTDYANVGGVGKELNDSLPIDRRLLDHFNCGILKKTAVKVAEVTDGLSNTVLLLECAGRPRLYQNGRLIPDGATPKTWFGSASVTRPFPTGGVWASHNKGFLVDGAVADGNTATRPGTCAVNCSNDNEVYSFHTGGAEALMADGSIRFLSTSLPIDQLVALVSRNGSEVISADR